MCDILGRGEVKTRIVHGLEKFQYSPSTKVHFAEGGVVCWKNRSHRSNAHLRPQPRTIFVFFFFKSYSVSCFVKNLKIPLNFCWVLCFLPNYSDYSCGLLLVFGACVFFRFLI